MKLTKFTAILKAAGRAQKRGEPWALWNEDLMPLGYKLVLLPGKKGVYITNIKPQSAGPADLIEPEDGDHA